MDKPHIGRLALFTSSSANKKREYVAQQVPTEISVGLLDWLRREFKSIEHSISPDVLPSGGASSHPDLTERDAADSHPQSAITGLVDRLDAVEAALAAKLDTAWAVAHFAVAAYGNLHAPLNVVFGNITTAWHKIDFLTQSRIAPRGVVTDTVNSSFSFDYAGVHHVSVDMAFTHNAPTDTASTYLRVYNETDAVALSYQFSIPIMRTIDKTEESVGFLMDVAESEIGKTFVLQIGGGNTISTVTFLSFDVSINAEGEWRGAA